MLEIVFFYLHISDTVCIYIYFLHNIYESWSYLLAVVTPADALGDRYGSQVTCPS